MKQTHVVCIGGGSGLSSLLRGLKPYPLKLTAIVAMTDNGSSSGRLRRQFKIVPPGDVRKCLIALSEHEAELARLFDFRFASGRGLSGHSLGNLLLMALCEQEGSFAKAVEQASLLLATRGTILPATLSDAHIGGRLASGQELVGEQELVRGGHRSAIEDIFLVPAKVAANPAAVAAIAEADVIVIGPGSLYTSVLTNFLIAGIRRAVQTSTAKKLYVCNVSTERGETERYTVEQHVAALLKYGGDAAFDTVIVNDHIVRSNDDEGKLGHIRNITTKSQQLLGKPVHLYDVVSKRQPLFHDADKLAAAILAESKE